MILLNAEPLLILDMEKVELLMKLHNYVKHKEHVWANTTWYKDRNRRLDTVQDLLKLAARLRNYQNTCLICQEINASRFALRYILPDPNNKSYQSSADALVELINFCRQKLHLPAYDPFKQKAA